MEQRLTILSATAACLAVGLATMVRAEVDEIAGAAPTVRTVKPATPVKWTTAVEPKPLSNRVLRGLKWLVQNQNDDGGWSQGELQKTRRTNETQSYDRSNVGDTCFATLALLRSGSTPAKGQYVQPIGRGLDFVCKQIQASDDKGLWITDVRSTRLQAKLGRYVDTFLSAMVLAEVKDQMPDEASRKTIIAALDKVMDKIEKNQKPDGTWDDRGWASGLQQGLAAKAVNRAAQLGVDVDETVRQRSETNAAQSFDKVSGKFSKRGSAGVELYAGSSNMAAMQDSVNTNANLEPAAEKQLREAKTDAQRVQAKKQIARFKSAKEKLADQKAAVIKRLDDKRFVAGFGSNGGEEFLSYMNIGEALVVDGGDDWKKWDKSITDNMNRIQNQDGSWSGHHCITGRTFCTSAALLTLMVDRAPVPLAAKIKKRR